MFSKVPQLDVIYADIGKQLKSFQNGLVDFNYFLL